IDPDAFSAMLENNFDKLIEDRMLNLAPIWESLSRHHAPSELCGLFVRFEEEAQRFGLASKQPTTIEVLTLEQRRAFVADLDAPLGAPGRAQSKSIVLLPLSPVTSNGNLLAATDKVLPPE